MTDTTDVRTNQPSRPRRRIPTFLQRSVLAAALLGTFAAGIGADRIGLFGEPAGASTSIADRPEFQTLQETWDLIHEQYVDESAINDSALLYGAASGMVDALGDTGHSTFLSPDEAVRYQEATSGELIGIGVEVDFRDDRPVVVAPIDGSPAANQGVKAGDVITAVDGKSTDQMRPEDLFDALRGDEGTTVDVSFERPATGEDYTLRLTRTKIKVQPVAWSMLPGKVALIRLSEFTPGATDGVKKALEEAKAKGATRLILDLRNNPGGLVFEALGVASQFLPEGSPVYQTKNRGEDPKTIRSVGIGKGTDLPLVVLINEGSASSSEIVASALQDNGRATLVGETTFGTGTVLTPNTLEDGSVVLLGTQLWLTAKGNQIWHVGVDPAIRVELPADASVYRAKNGASVDEPELEATGDTQLLRAVDAVGKLAGS